MVNLFKHELFSRWVAILGWGIALAAFAAMYIGIYPEMAAEVQGLAGLSIYRAMGIDLASFAGFIASVVIQILPIILGVYVIMISTGTLGGEEDNGTLELVVAMPLPRWQIVAMKTAALAVVIFAIMIVMAIGATITLIIVSNSIEVDVTPVQLFVAVVGAYPLMLAFYGIGLLLSTLVPNRRTAIVIMTIFYVGSYVLNSIGTMIESLNYFKAFSLFGYLNTSASVFTEGVDPLNILLLIGIFVVTTGLAMWSFNGRNITVGQWIWQRA